MNTNRRKAFRTIADVLHSPIAELAALRRKPAQKTDRVMRSSKLEDSIYAELVACKNSITKISELSQSFFTRCKR